MVRGPQKVIIKLSKREGEKVKLRLLLPGVLFIATTMIYAAEVLPDIPTLESLPQDSLEQIAQDLSYTELVNLMHTSHTLKTRLQPEFDKRQLIGYWETGEIKSDVLKGHTHPVYSVAFSPNGQQLASGSSDDTVRIWYAVPKK